MKRDTWSIALEIASIALVFFTATRTFDLLHTLLGDDNVVLTLFGLVAIDVGFVVWMHYHIYAARGKRQKSISLWLTGICLTGVIVSFIGDLIMRTGRTGLTHGLDENLTIGIIIALGVVIAANIVGFFVVKASDPDTEQTDKQRQMFFDINQKALDQMDVEKDAIAKQMIPDMIDAWKEKTRLDIQADTQRKYGARLPDADKDGKHDLGEALDSGSQADIASQVQLAKQSLGPEQFAQLMNDIMGNGQPSSLSAPQPQRSDNGRETSPKV
jgi:hypothetical protein